MQTPAPTPRLLGMPQPCPLLFSRPRRRRLRLSGSGRATSSCGVVVMLGYDASVASVSTSTRAGVITIG
jgi:hypothetical protein